MIGKYILLAIIGLGAGTTASAGVFAFFVTLGIVPRIADKTKTGKHIISYENAIILGGIWGNLFSIFLNWRFPVGDWFLWLYGLGAGIYVGCISIALAEILHVFPVLFHRLKLRTGLNTLIFVMAAGKTVGALWFFLHQMKK